MKKFIIFLIIFIIIAFAGFMLIRYKNNSNNNSSNYSGVKISAEQNTQENNNQNKNELANTTNTNTNTQNDTKPKETELASCSTPIIIDDNNRDKNLKITADKINGTIVKNGEEFSFNDTVGNPTEEKGYEKAGAFSNGKKIKTYGGGNCQVSTTIYDTALKVKGIEITERHEHGKSVGYVKEGKDATVAYDYLDLKFKNNTGHDIKIYASVGKEKVNVKIVKLGS